MRKMTSMIVATAFVIVSISVIWMAVGHKDDNSQKIQQQMLDNKPPLSGPPPQADVSWIKNFHKDIAYADVSPTQKLDIALPNEGQGPFPVIIGVHGGGFKFGDKGDGWSNSMLEGVRYGYAVVNINYRLSDEAIWPAPINDLKAAIRWVKANAAKYNLDPNKIALWGGSAGGHLVALAGTSGGVAELEDYKLAPEAKDQSSSVQAVVDWYGPNDFLKMDTLMAQEGFTSHHSDPGSFESAEMGTAITSIPDKVKQANPNTYIKPGNPDFPRFLIQHGDKDDQVPYLGSKELYEAIKAAGYGDRVNFEMISGAGHADKKFEMKENLEKVFDFLNKTLKTSIKPAPKQNS